MAPTSMVQGTDVLKNKITAISIAVLIVSGLVGLMFVGELPVYVPIIALGLALALQKYVASFFGYFVIVFSHMFQVGDRIRIGSWKGDVRDVRMFHFVLDEVGEDEKLGGELTGRILNMPNLIVLDQPVLNFSKGHSPSRNQVQCDYIFDEIRVPLTSNSNIHRAAQLLETIIGREDAKYLAEARCAFRDNYPAFLKEAESNRRVLVHIEPARIWIKGKFVAPYRLRNDLRSRMYLQFLEEASSDSDIHLA